MQQGMVQRAQAPQMMSQQHQMSQQNMNQMQQAQQQQQNNAQNNSIQQQQMQQQQQAQQQAQLNQQQQQQAAAQAEDPIVKIKELVPKLKGALSLIMDRASKALLNNKKIDDVQNGLKAENSSEFRTNLEHAFEDFYHQADLLEATIRLAQQQCLNTFASVASISSNHIHFLTPPRNGPPNLGSMELPRYNEYLDIIKDQINCANEATAILQKTYNELQSVDQNFQQHVRRGANQSANNNANNSNPPTQQQNSTATQPPSNPPRNTHSPAANTAT